MDFQPFRFYVQKILPLAMDDSLSYYEVLLKVRDKLNEIGTTLNETTGTIHSLSENFNELQNYVNNWFDNVNLDKETENAVSKLVNSGDFANMVLTSLASYMNPVFVSSVSQMKSTSGMWAINSPETQNLWEYQENQLVNTNLIYKGNVATENELPETPETGRDAYQTLNTGHIWYYAFTPGIWIDSEKVFRGSVTDFAQMRDINHIYVLTTNYHVYAWNPETETFSDTGIIYGLSGSDFQWRGMLDSRSTVPLDALTAQTGWYGLYRRTGMNTLPSGLPSGFGNFGFMLVFKVEPLAGEYHFISLLFSTHTGKAWIHGAPYSSDNQWREISSQTAPPLHNKFKMCASIAAGFITPTYPYGTTQWRLQSACVDETGKRVFIFWCSNNSAYEDSLVTVIYYNTYIDFITAFATHQWDLYYQFFGHVNTACFDPTDGSIYISSGGVDTTPLADNIPSTRVFKWNPDDDSVETWNFTGIQNINSIFWMNGKIVCSDNSHIFSMNFADSTCTQIPRSSISKTFFYNTGLQLTGNTLHNQVETSHNNILYKLMYVNTFNQIDAALIVQYDLNSMTQLSTFYQFLAIRQEIEYLIFVDNIPFLLTDGYFPSLYISPPSYSYGDISYNELATRYGSTQYMLSLDSYYYTNNSSATQQISDIPVSALKSSMCITNKMLCGTAIEQTFKTITNPPTIFKRRILFNNYGTWGKFASQPDE